MAGKLVTRCAEPYAEGDVVTVQLDMEQHHVAFLKNGVLQGAGEGLPGESCREGGLLDQRWRSKDISGEKEGLPAPLLPFYRLSLGSAWFYVAERLLPSLLLSRNLDFR